MSNLEVTRKKKKHGKYIRPPSSAKEEVSKNQSTFTFRKELPYHYFWKMGAPSLFIRVSPFVQQWKFSALPVY